VIDIGDVFESKYGDKKYESKGWLSQHPGTTPLIASGGVENGVYGLFDIPATKQHVISIARTGSVGATFYHGYPCEISSDAIVLLPKETLSKEDMLWYAMGIRQNQFRFNYGRKVTPTRVDAMRVPAPPKSLPSIADGAIAVSRLIEEISLDDAESDRDRKRGSVVGDMFESRYGNSYELCNLQRDPSGINFVSRRMGNNGVSAKVARTEDDPFPAGRLTVALSGNGVLETCVQATPFYTGFHVAVLTPKLPMSLADKLFYAHAIRMNRFRYGFGRQANRTLPAIPLPTPPQWVCQSTIDEARREVTGKIRHIFSVT
jgi:type I restriction modification DNA specificity protein